ncbi:MAG: hypothetical protein UU47_C0005G0034 [candidate division TM6 bacterium GW2011_GWE2_41_16]|nr:MAG: hypothetical protein UU47_C0005G0034 [candidate division TM6 bacterium GW2011_GWE2_41_16]
MNGEDRIAHKKLPIGISDYPSVINGSYFYVDKTLLIKEILDRGVAATLLVRPRRFGKTLNLSMIRTFFEKTPSSTAHLFWDFAIAKYPDCMSIQGTKPVIFFSLKDIKGESWSLTYDMVRRVVADELRRHAYLLDTAVLDESEKRNFMDMIDGSASEAVYTSVLKNLSRWLYAYHGVKPIILIDEYDTPVHEGFAYGYYDRIIRFIRDFLGAGLKDNSALEFAFVTGILRVAKESVFSDLNNLFVCSMLDEAYASAFGLLEHEVLVALAQYYLADRIDVARSWYDGYCVGSEQHVYNPWSIINFLDQKGSERAYWINTSTNTLIRTLIEKSSAESKIIFERLMAGEAVRLELYEHISFSDIEHMTGAVWSFLLSTGYLTYQNFELIDGHMFADVLLPNNEVKYFYAFALSEWIKGSHAFDDYEHMLKALDTGDSETFIRAFEQFVTESLSYFDVSGSKPELFYHAFVLGMLVGLRSTHDVRSNRESGYGRYDVMVIPKDQRKKGYIFEFKKVDLRRGELLDEAATSALDQIESRQYAKELEDRDIAQVISFGIAFAGKHVCIKMR